MNHVIIIGHVGADPEARQTKTGKMVCNFTVATNSHLKDGSKTTTWHRVVTWERRAEVCVAYLKKGSKVAVAGRLQTRQYEDKDGRTCKSTEIVAHMVNFLDARPTDSESASQSQAASSAIPPVRHFATGEDDKIPF